MDYFGKHKTAVMEELMDHFGDRAYDSMMFLNDPSNLEDRDYLLGYIELAEALIEELTDQVKYLRKIEKVE